MRTKGLAVLALVLALVLSAPGCVEPGRARISIPVHGAGTGVRTFTVGDTTVTLTEARIAWGPAYFCTTAFADVDLCPTALAEVRSGATIDVLDPMPQFVGSLDGISGTVRSAMFDYGISWLLPAAAPSVGPGAVDGVHSARFAGSATRGVVTRRFLLDVDIAPASSGVSAAHGVPTMHTLTEQPDALVVRFDPSTIFAGADFSEVLAVTGDPVVLGETSSLYQSVVIGLSTSALPALEWARP